MSPEQPDEPQGFAALGLRPELLRALASLGYEEPTPIQRRTIPLLLSGRDLLGQAATGTGKTAAFALPVLNSIEPGEAAIPVCLVLTPTRELAMQVSEAMHKYGSQQGVRVLPIYGGQPITRQFAALDRGAHVVVATPGRALDHIRRGSLTLGSIRTVILDEADEMLDMGFAEDIEEILDGTPAERQTVLFSATMPGRIRAIAKRHQRDPEHIVVGASGTESGTVARINQRVYFVNRHHKASALGRILDIEAPQAALVFCKTRNEVDELTATMNGRGYRAESLHGGMDQSTRDRVVARVREGSAELLIATDVAARGLDIDTLTHVVNYDVPSAPESYVHRIGRVGRAGREGTAVTLAEPRQRRLLDSIERLTKQTIAVGKVPSVADLRARQIEVTVAAVRDALDADDLGDYSPVFDALLQRLGQSDSRPASGSDGEPDSEPGEPDSAIDDDSEAEGRQDSEAEGRQDSEAEGRQDSGAEGRQDSEAEGRQDSEAEVYRRIALAAIKLVHEARGAVVDEQEIPPSAESPRRDGKRKGDDKADWKPKGAARGRTNGDTGNGETAFLWIGAGRNANVRPGDLVGAVANESGLTGRQIGPIRISDRFSVVGVPAASADHVIKAMSSATLRGTRVQVRRYRD